MKVLIRLLFCLMMVSGSSVIWAGNPIHLIVLHVNDTHGKLQPHNTNSQTDIGGIARLSSLVKQIRQENPKNVLFLHAGDIFSRGDPVTVYYGGYVNLLAYEKMGVDAITPGNGEFYLGIENLQRQAARVSTPFVHANVTYKHHGGSIFPPYLIKNVNGVRVGILGLGLIRTWHQFDAKVESDPEIEALLKRYGDPLSEVICRTEIDLPNLRRESSPLGDLVAKAVHIQTRADLAILYGNSNTPGLKAGDIRLADVSRIRLYHSPVVTGRLTGVQVQSLLSERFCITSGCQFDKVDKHVTNLVINGKPADPAATYLVATEKQTVFRSPVFDSLQVDLTGQRVDTALERYLRRVSVIQ